MTRAALVLALAAGPLLAGEPSALDCQTAAGQGFRVALFSAARAEAPTHCVTGLPILDDLHTCAPDGGWGLTSFDGVPNAVRIAVRAPAAHDGGWFFARVGPSEFVASASVGTRPPLTLEVAGETFWRIRLDLASGEGSVFTTQGEERVRCSP